MGGVDLELKIQKFVTSAHAGNAALRKAPVPMPRKYGKIGLKFNLKHSRNKRNASEKKKRFVNYAKLAPRSR